MTAMELRERKRNPEEEAAYFSSACKDKDGFDVKYINPDTGRGIFSSVHFDKGDFLLEYRGELINDSLGRLVNDDHVRPDSKMKTITVAGKPHLCLFATRSITPGEEITYNYGDSEWPWRCKNIAVTDALVSANSVLAKKNQMQPEELLPQVPRDATHKVPEEGPFASPMMVTLPPVKERAQIKSEADVLVTTIPLLTEKDQMQPEELHPQFSREATHEVIEAVKKVSGYDEEKNCYQTPSLALKLGHTLQKVCEIIHCRALMAEDEELIKSTETFKKLYTTKWSEMISHTALSPLNEAKFNKPSTLPFTHDVQLLHKHLETTANAASENLKKAPSPQSYAKLAKTTLARIIVFNRRRAGEVSKMQLKSFQERDKTLLHEDVAAGLSPFEQKLCSHFCRVEIKGKRGRKVAVLLTPDMVDALTLLVSKRKACGVQDANCFLFSRPSCQSHYRGQDCLRLYAMHCGAQNPEHLRSTHLRKHVATLSQILNLKNSELDQVADFLGHDIRVHREYYRLPEATTQLAKISKLLLAMEKGCLPDLQGKSLDDIEIEDEINSTDDSDGSEPENAAMDDAMSVPRQTGCEVISFADTEPEAPTVTTQTFMDEVDTPTVHPLAGNESHEDADVEVEAEDINTLTDTQLDDTKATFSQTLAEIETLKKDTPEIETRKHQEKKKTRRGTRGKGRKIHYKKKGEQVM
ncbi:hypothetical protein AOLI_G00242880 [Acnodon oligacanthus]